MRVTRIGWGGYQDKRVQRHGGLPPNGPRADHQPRGLDFAAFQLPEGGTEVRPRRPGPRALLTGPVVGFVVEDLTAAVRELEAAGVELLAGRWTSAAVGAPLRAPDGNVYELTSG